MTTTDSTTNLTHPFLSDQNLLDEAALKLLKQDRIRFDRLWAYYRNPMRICQLIDESSADRPYRQAQEWGLPTRITGSISGESVFSEESAEEIARKEVVIENDIGWRIDTMIDFLFGKPLVINSSCQDLARQSQIEIFLRNVLERNGGLVFLQQTALLSAVYGSVDVLVKYLPEKQDETSEQSKVPTSAESAPVQPLLDSMPPAPSDMQVDDPKIADVQSLSAGELDRLARRIRFEIVEPARALPLLDPLDCRRAVAFATVYQIDRKCAPASSKRSWVSRWLEKKPVDPKKLTILELVTESKWQRIEDGQVVTEGANSLGRLPVVHIQNTPDPMSYHGNSDVESLIPIQDELNTRLSDRAHRVAMTSLRMYLGKGIENFNSLPIGPGRMWSTDNPDAEIKELGGDGNAPGEQAHIDDIREAMDKLSGVSPIAAGAIKGRIGRLSSAAALRVTMMALLSRTERKRTIFASAIAQLCELSLAWLDVSGELKTEASERGISISWSNPIPVNEIERLEEARAKQIIGLPTETILRELGYDIQPARRTSEENQK